MKRFPEGKKGGAYMQKFRRTRAIRAKIVFFRFAFLFRAEGPAQQTCSALRELLSGRRQVLDGMRSPGSCPAAVPKKMPSSASGGRFRRQPDA